MKKSSLIFFILILFLNTVQSQNQIPQVPSEMEFGGLKLTISESAKKEIQKDINMLRSSDKYFQIKVDRALLYFPIIETVFAELGVPQDFKYLSVQESALISDVVSSSNAVGFWQFKDFTGREVGLRIDHKVDERKNIVAASRGAATYLKRNNFLYDNWIYALTAYYAGPGGASKYANREYFGAKKMRIDKNTHWYVKRFLAHKIAFEESLNREHSEGLKLLTYEKGEGKNLDRIAREFDVDPKLVKHYNKWLSTGNIPSDKTYAVIIPVTDKKAEKYIAKAENSKEQKPDKEIKKPDNQISFPKELIPGLLNHESIDVKINGVPAILAGQMDNVSSISAEAGINPEKFMKYNDLESKSLKPGEVYYLRNKKSRSSIDFHVVRQGETMWSISQRYGIRLKSLYKKNRMEIGETVNKGRLLWMSSKRPKNTDVEYYTLNEEKEFTRKETVVKSNNGLTKPIKNPKPEEKSLVNNSPEQSTNDDYSYTEIPKTSLAGKKHKITPGETLWIISQKYDVEIEQLREWNNLTKYDTLRVDQELFIEAPKLVEKSNSDRKKKVYVVKPGDTLYRIANMHNMDVTELMSLNEKKDSSLEVGEKLLVYNEG